MGKLTALTKYGSTIIPRTPKELPTNSLLLRKQGQKGIRLPKSDVSEIQHGQHIYLYNHIRTKQVVYSLTRHLNNKDALDQITFVGKKTVPARLRKDLWTPFCMVSFPSPHAGLAAYRKLREFRRLHEFAYPLDLIIDKENVAKDKKGNPKPNFQNSLLPRKKRSKVLMDQKANSVADLAAVLLQQEKVTEEGILESQRQIELAKMRLKKKKANKEAEMARIEMEREKERGAEGVMVRWADMLDAEYAETWPEAVVHDSLEKSRYTAAYPIKEPAQLVDDGNVMEYTTRALGKRGYEEERRRKLVDNTIMPETQEAAVATA